MTQYATAPAPGAAPVPRGRSTARPAPDPARPRRPAPTATPLGHVRATGIGFAAILLLAGVVYPLVVVGFAQVTTPTAANGSLVTGPNGTIVGSIMVGQNLSLPSLFWGRPSVTDFEMVLGAPSPPGPADPALKAEVLAYLAEYRNFTYNGSNASLTGTFTQWILSDSASGVDPDILPSDALVQIPRIELATHLTSAELTALVNAHIAGPLLGIPGPSYVNVLELDIALVETPGY